MASMAPSHDDQLDDVEWLWEVNNVVDNAPAEPNHGYPTLSDEIDLTVKNALAESDYGSPNLFEEFKWTMDGNKAFEDGLVKPIHGSPDLFGWTTSGDNTTFGNTLNELDHHGSSNQVELRDPAQVQINDFIDDVRMTEASLVILPNNTGSTTSVPENKAKRPRKKPIRWTSEEHGLFLEGLEKYGKGDWRSISRFSVVTRTPAQVASHAQKYFNRLKKSQNSHGNSNTATRH